MSTDTEFSPKLSLCCYF